MSVRQAAFDLVSGILERYSKDEAAVRIAWILARMREDQLDERERRAKRLKGGAS